MKQMEVAGFTGTQHTITQAQIEWLHNRLHERSWRHFHHGACIGADAMAHHLALHNPAIEIWVHPPEKLDKVAMNCLKRHITNRVHVLPRKPYLDRDRDIVDACELLFALPNGPEDENPRSGTWYTIRYAVKVGKPVLICWPDGRIEPR